MKRAKVHVAPEILRDHLFGRESYAITSATIENVSMGADGRIIIELVGDAVPDGRCTALFKTAEAAGGAKVAVFQGLLPN